MAKKTIVGVDIGDENLKIAVVNDSKVLKTILVTLPDYLVQDGELTSIEALSEIIRNTLKENHISAKLGAFVLSGEHVYTKDTVMPLMTDEQLKVNLPYEFRDYITDELKNYLFDYSMISSSEELEAATNSDERASMQLTAVAVPISLIEQYRELARKSGLKLVKAAPALSSFSSLLRRFQGHAGKGNKEYCILDVGSEAIRMYIYQGDCYEITRELNHGVSDVHAVVAEQFNVDIHLARTYFHSNHENCQYHEACVEVYNRLAIELMRAINFYRFSNPDNHLNDMWIIGGGDDIVPFVDAIKESIDINVHDASSLIPNSQACNDPASFLEAIGIALDA